MLMEQLGHPVFDEEKGTLILSVGEALFDLREIADKVERNGFVRKDEFHITIFGFKAARAVKDALGKSPRTEIEPLIQNTNWEFSLRPEWYYVSKHYTMPYFEKGMVRLGEKRESLIQMVSMPGAKQFYDRLNELLGTHFTLPPLHITLYTRGDNSETSKIGIAIESDEDFSKLNPQAISSMQEDTRQFRYEQIVIPTRPQPDTIVGIFLLKIFGRDKYPGIQDAAVEVLSRIPEGDTAETLTAKGILPVDVGGGVYDHHNKQGTTVSQLIAEDLGIEKYTALAKLLKYAERDDKYGMGTVSEDQLDRSFGLSGLIAALNKSLPNEPQYVFDYALPFLVAHYLEEMKRTEGLPKEFEEKQRSGKAEVLKTKHKKKNVTVVVIESDDPSMAGWLRSVAGARADVVVQKNSSGYVNIITNQFKKIDLREIAALVRKEESALRNRALSVQPFELTRPGRIEQVPEWYYDRATNSLLNGGTIPKGVSPTVIPLVRVKDLTIEGLNATIIAKPQYQGSQI